MTGEKGLEVPSRGGSGEKYVVRPAGMPAVRAEKGGAGFHGPALQGPRRAVGPGDRARHGTHGLRCALRAHHVHRPPMSSRNLMRACARGNRVFRDRPGGSVVACPGIADSIEHAPASMRRRQASVPARRSKAGVGRGPMARVHEPDSGPFLPGRYGRWVSSMELFPCPAGERYG